jgi:hypothetical protein
MATATLPHRLLARGQDSVVLGRARSAALAALATPGLTLIRSADGTICGGWQLQPLRHGSARLVVRPLRIPAEHFCSACGVVSSPDVEVSVVRDTVSVTCRCGAWLGEF